MAGMVASILTGYQVTTTGNWALPFYTAAGGIVVAALVMAFGVSAQPLVLTQREKIPTVQPELAKG
jgi:hypothetical protein